MNVYTHITNISNILSYYEVNYIRTVAYGKWKQILWNDVSDKVSIFEESLRDRIENEFYT